MKMLVFLIAVITWSIAATVTVTNTNDSGPGSLREAILDSVIDDVITITATGQITLASSLPEITESLSIVGNGSDQLSISGNNLYRIFFINGAINGVVDVTLQGITLKDANSTQSGGAIYVSNINSCTLTINDINFTNNYAAKSGGALFIFPEASNGTLAISNSHFNSNSTSGAGGALYFLGKELIITDSSFTANSATGATGVGGALYIGVPTAEINSTTFSDNITTDKGGAIYLRDDGLHSELNFMSINQSSFVNNRTLDSHGGAIYTNNVALHLNNSLLNYNFSGDEGGGIYYYVKIGDIINPLGNHILNSTFSYNYSDTHGGAISVHMEMIDLNISHTTITLNSSESGGAGGDGGGLYLFSGNAFIKNSIIANNNKNGDPNNCWANGGFNLTTNGYNIVMPDNPAYSTFNTCMFTHPTDTNSTVILEPLADNGGPTKTHALPKDSIAIDTGECSDNDNIVVTTDQRGKPRNGQCDVGAFELQSTGSLPVLYYLLLN